MTSPPMAGPALPAATRAALLAETGAAELIGLADACLAGGPTPQVLTAPQVGTVVAQVRDPIADQRFHLGDVLACRAEVALGEARGWAMRLGDDRAATLAAAICDAEAAGGRPLAARVEAMCRDTERRLAAAEAAEWAVLAPTVVEFEELT